MDNTFQVPSINFDIICSIEKVIKNLNEQLS